MGSSYFKGLIHCTKCGKFYNSKKNGNKQGFICSGFKNYGKEYCDSKFIHLDVILNLINKHCEIHGKKYSIEKTKIMIHKIEIGDEGIVIRWKDSLVSKLSDEKIIF